MHADPAEAAAVAECRRLLGEGRADRAVEALLGFARAHPQNAGTRRLAADILYRQGLYKQAAPLWGAVAALVPGDIEALARFAHALIESGAAGEAETAVAALHRACAGLSPAARRALHPLGHSLYTHAHRALLAGDREKAWRLYGILLGCDDVTGLMVAGHRPAEAVPSADSAAEMAAFGERLRAARRRWSAGETPRPPLAGPGGEGYREVLRRHAGKKVLLATRTTIYPDRAAQESEVHQFVRPTARQAGLQPLLIDANPIVYHNNYGTRDKEKAIGDLVAAVRDFRPDILFADCFLYPDPIDAYDAPYFVNLMSELKRSSGCRVICFYSDLWRANQAWAMETSLPFADAILHGNPGFEPVRRPDLADRNVCSILPMPDHGGRPGDPRRDVFASFVGSIDFYYLRALWTLLIEAEKLPVDVHLTSHRKGADEFLRTTAEFLAYQRRSKIAVNLSRRQLHSNLLNGREFRSPLAGCLALEEDNPDLALFFVPDVHYVPFSGIGELRTALRFFQAHDDERLAVAEAGQAWFNENYASDRVWARLLTTLFGDQEKGST